MPYQVEKTGELSCVASVMVPAEDFRRSYNKALKELSQRVKLAGFRKGKIPMSVMKKNYGGAVLNDVIDELVNTNVQALLEETEDVIFLAQPEVKELPTEEKGFEFTVAFELRPQVDPVGYMGLEVGKPEPELEEGAIEARLSELLKQHAALEPVTDRDTIEEGDTVVLDFHAVGDDEALKSLSGEGVSIVVGSNQALPGIEEALKGIKFETAASAKVTLNDEFPVEELRNKEVELKLDIKSVKRESLPALDDEFAKDTGLGETLEEAREALKTQLLSSKEEEAKRIAEQNLIEALLEQHSFQIPERFLEQQVAQNINSQLQQLRQQGIDPSMLGLDFKALIADMRPSRERQLRTEFLLMAIADKEKVEVGEEDFKAFVTEQAPQMGATVAQYERYLRGDQDRMMQVLGSIRLQKTLDMLVKEASFVKIEWPSADQEDGEDAAGGEEE